MVATIEDEKTAWSHFAASRTVSFRHADVDDE
jgi:hypothetical protein